MPTNRPNNLPELLLPAGSFDSALAAMEGGADALYFGFSDFSARKQARNLDRLEYRRLLRRARENGVRLYATLNTVILENELPSVLELLSFLGRFAPDAVIVQDWGLVRLIRARYPGIAIHASTQTAIQGAEAARLAAQLGVTRIVLPRETSLESMRRLKAEFPEMEFEVFVHGALCYSFSGLCLASGLLLGRSGNRGECAQICRSYYDMESGPSAPGGTGYWFSCRDLCLATRLPELEAAGISSLKVEGRMKSPEYCYAVARLYRASLDSLPPEEFRDRLEIARTAFAREGTEGWLFERGGANLIDALFPGHRGVAIGRFAGAGGGRAVLELSSSLGLRDGILAFEGVDSTKPIQFSVADLRDGQTGRPLASARPGDIVEFACPGNPRAGSEARRISDRRQDRRAPSPEEYPPATSEIPLRLSLSDGRFIAEIGLPRFDGTGNRGETAAIEPGEPLKAERARTPGGFLKAISIFAESGDADFKLAPGGDLSSLADLFVPPSVLKREKNRIYARARELVEAAQADYARLSLGSAASIPVTAAETDSFRPRGDRLRIDIPPRSALVFRRKELPSGLPFASPRDLRSGADLPRYGGFSWLPLMPLVADVAEYESLAAERIRAEVAEGNRLAVGVGALHHIAFARRLVRDFAGSSADAERLSFFIDVHLYIANRHALAAFDSLLPRIAFAYSYIEAQPEPSIAALPDLPPIAPVGGDFSPPLFLSLGCLLKHHSGHGRCPADCGRAWSTHLADRDRKYVAIVEDCVSMLFRISKPVSLR